MKESNNMIMKGYKFFTCKKCGKDYPAKSENPNGYCLDCLQNSTDNNL